jgi:hypothetical protein
VSSQSARAVAYLTLTLDRLPPKGAEWMRSSSSRDELWSTCEIAP